jgi:hypothetical protein
MNEQERGMIDGLFERLREAESQAGPRDRDAEAMIAERMASQPGAAYMLAQVVLVQEQGLKNITNRVEEMERQLAERPQSGSGFLGGLFGGAPRPAAPAEPAARTPAATSGGWSNPRPGVGLSGTQGGARAGMQPGAQGGGFMAGAMQTAVGVAGGMLLANAVGGLFAGDAEAAPAEAAPEMPPEAPLDDPAADEGGGFFDGFFGGDDEEF